MSTPGGLVDKQELIDAQLDTAHLGRVVNSKDASGAPINTSTNRTGGVNKTLDALEAEYLKAIQGAGGEAINNGVWAGGVQFTAYNQFMVYNGVAYKPKTTTTLPYTSEATPNVNNVQPFSDINSGNLSDYTDIVYESVADLSSGIPLQASAGSSIIVSERANAKFMVVSGGTPNGYDIIDAGNGNTAELQPHKTVDISNFGADVSGTTSQLSTLQAIFEYARVRSLEVTGTGEVLISGTGDIDIYTNCNFTQIKWLVESWDGRFRVQRTKPLVTYGAGTPELAELQASTDVIKGSRVFNGVSSGSNLENAYCIINTSQPFFWYRGAIRNRQIFTRFYNNGVTSNERLYDLDASLITSVEVMPIEDSFLYIKGFNFSRIDEGNQGLLTVHRTLTIVDGIVVSHDGVGLTDYDGQIGISKTYGSVLRSANSTVTEKTGVYSLFFGESCDCIIENFKSDGEGWGATGSDSCSDMTFNDCSLSRIDAHAPIFNDLIINNCHIGNDGIIVQAMGDITMRGGSLSRSPGNFMGAISSRPDTGGACDANIILDGVRITGSAPTQSGNDDILFRCQGDPLAPAIPGSPVVQRFFNKITLLNMNITSPYVMFMQRTSGVVIDAPSEIEISGVRYLVENGIMRFDIGGFSTPTINAESGYSTKISLRRTDVDRIQILNSSNLTHRLLFDMSGCYNSKGSGVSIETIFGGDYLITNTALSAIDTFNGTYPVTPVSFKVSNGVYIPKTALSTFPEVFTMQNPDDASFVNIDMKYKSATQQNGFNSLNKKDALTRVIAF